MLNVLGQRGYDLEVIRAAIGEALYIRQRERIRVNNQKLVRDDIETLTRANNAARTALASLTHYVTGWNDESPHLRTLRDIIAETDENPHLRTLRDIIAETDENLSDIRDQIEAAGFEVRRVTRGKPQEHVATIHTKLAALGIPRFHRTELLQALGFV